MPTTFKQRRPLALGFAVPMFAAPGIPTFRTPSVARLQWFNVLSAILESEDLGYDSAWFSDHLFLGRDGDFLESWTTLSAAAAVTSRLRLVSNHLGIGFRSVPLIAKMAATVDVISKGRFELFVSHGMREREHVSYGFNWQPDIDLRVARLSEGIDVIRLLWESGDRDFSGQYFQLVNAVCAPSPEHRIPVWLGGPLRDSIIDMIVSKADGWNALPVSLQEYRAQVQAIDVACCLQGRDPGSLQRSLETQVLILDHSDDWQRWLDFWASLRLEAPLGIANEDMFPTGTNIYDYERVSEECFESFIIGTREEVTEKLNAFQQLGVDEVVCWFMDWPKGDSMRILAQEIRPNLG